MRFRYGLDEMPPWGQWLAFGLQWFILAVPPLIIMGKVVAGLQSANVEAEILYLQRLSLVTGLTLMVQILWGHRLPLILGPSSVLLVGMIASQTRGIDAIYFYSIGRCISRTADRNRFVWEAGSVLYSPDNCGHPFAGCGNAGADYHESYYR